MADTTPPPVFSSPEMPESAAPELSVWTRIGNVLSAPSEAFDGIVAQQKKTMLWLAPMFIAVIVGTVFAYMMFSNPGLQQRMRQQTSARMQEQVQAGKLTQEQADKALDMQSGATQIFSVIGPLFAVPIMWLILGGVFFAIMSFMLGGEVSFLNVFIVFALASVIMSVEALVTGLMQIATSELTAQPSLAMLVSGKDSPYLHAVLGRINPFTYWWLWVMCTGMAKISGLTMRKTMIGIVGIWLVWSVAMIAMAGLSYFQQWN